MNNSSYDNSNNVSVNLKNPIDDIPIVCKNKKTFD